jgi:hypothetical protein
MVAMGLTIAEFITAITAPVIMVFGSFEMTAIVLSIMFFILIAKLGMNFSGILFTGYLALILYFAGAFGYGSSIGQMIGVLIFIILSFVIVMALRSIGG